jgi:SAM-dependent methyltransferase
MASESSCIYSSSPKVYDIAFSFRDFEAEAAFLLEAHGAFSSSSSTFNSFLEVGCGPARHALLLAQTGIPTRCVGVDVSPEMVDYARAKADEQGLGARAEFVVADMMSPDGYQSSVSNGSELFDAAAIMLGTFSHCLDNDSAIATLKNVAACVKHGGILVMELGNPRDIYQGAFCTDGFLNVWEIGESGDVDFAGDAFDAEGNLEQLDDPEPPENLENPENSEDMDGDELRVMVEYGREGDRFDVERGLLHRTVGFSLFDGGELVSSSVSVVQQRQYTLQELDLLAKLSGWTLLPQAVFGDFDFDVRLDDDAADRMICVFVKDS